PSIVGAFLCPNGGVLVSGEFQRSPGVSGNLRESQSSWPDLEVDMQPEHLHEDRPAIAVVAGMVDVLQTARRRHTWPEVRCVIRLDDVLATVPQPAVAKEESETAEGEVFTVRC